MTRRALYESLAAALLPLGWEHTAGNGWTLTRPYDGFGYDLARVTDDPIRPIVCVHVRETLKGGSDGWDARFSSAEGALAHLRHVREREQAMAQRA